MTIVSGLTIVVLSAAIAMWLNDNFNLGGNLADE